MNEDTKSLLASKTFWGTMLTLVGGLVPALHKYLGSGDVQFYASNAAVVAGAVFAVYGRIVATNKVSVSGK